MKKGSRDDESCWMMVFEKEISDEVTLDSVWISAGEVMNAFIGKEQE